MARLFAATLALLSLSAVLAGCAAGPADDPLLPPGPPPPGLGPGGDFQRGLGGEAARSLFISPAGQPFRAARGEAYPAAAWFAAADADRDGRLTRDEFVANAESYFAVLDANHDGQIDGFERDAYEKAMPELVPELRGLRAGEGMNPNLGRRGGAMVRPERGPRGGGSNQRGGAGLYALFDDPQPISAADVDQSGRISLAEFRGLAERRFATLDKAAAGALTLAGLPKTAAQQRAEAPPPQPGRNGRRAPPERLVSPPAIATSGGHREG